jgi:hypothetical protein
MKKAHCVAEVYGSRLSSRNLPAMLKDISVDSSERLIYLDNNATDVEFSGFAR